ncbi:MAG: hypothetical protein JW932_18685 [Deltaproteobacteria bacterium]|nr:hypothetical protein [Deltaproteobacteria bacterium]
MAKTDDMIRLFSQPGYQSEYLHAKANETCIKCKRPVGPFRDNASRFEYKISALCQECQDAYFQDESWNVKVTKKKQVTADSHIQPIRQWIKGFITYPRISEPRSLRKTHSPNPKP